MTRLCWSDTKNDKINALPRDAEIFEMMTGVSWVGLGDDVHFYPSWCMNTFYLPDTAARKCAAKLQPRPSRR